MPKTFFGQSFDRNVLTRFSDCGAGAGAGARVGAGRLGRQFCDWNLRF